MKIYSLPLSFFVDKLQHKEPFAFVRAGDGEFQAVLGYDGHNCDGTNYTPELAAALRRTLEQPRDYLYAIGPKITQRKNRLSRAALDYLDRRAKVTRWHDSEVFLTASLAGQLRPFIDALRERRVALVGAAHLRALPLAVAEFVEVPLVGAFEARAEIRAAVTDTLTRANVVLFCSGMLSKILIWELFPLVKTTHALIDIGSTFDQYAGRMSRGYARKLDAAEIARLRELNFGSEKE